jgi:hypothetical protein
MSQTPMPPDALDQALSDFFKAQMPRPWPAAPATAHATPSALATPRTDTLTRARLTLAASVALLLGTGWYLASGSPQAARGPTRPGPAGTPDFIGPGSAKMPGEFDRKADKAKATNDPMTGFQPGPITLP